MDFVEFINSVRSGIANMMQNSDDGEYLNADFWGYPSGERMIENIFNSGIISGLTEPTTTVSKIFCAVHDHAEIQSVNANIEKSTSFEPNAARFMFHKKPDICIRDNDATEDGWPNWFIQVKKGVDTHVKAAQALGDYLWGFVDKRYLSNNGIEDLNYAFVWFETVAKRKEDRWLHFDVPDFPMEGSEEDLSQMTLEFSPGYHLDLGIQGLLQSYGNIRFQRCDSAGATPWTNRTTRVLRPNNYAVVKQMLGTGTNSSYIRMFRQEGALSLTSQFAQFTVDETLCVYIHLLNPQYGLEDSGITEENSPYNERLFGWMP